MANGIMSLVRKLPVYAIDIKENLQRIFLESSNNHLTQEELYSIALAIGYALRNESVLNNIRADAKLVLEETNATACKIATIMMSMNNMLYNFKDINPEMSNIESGLSMTSFNNVDVEVKIFEMCCLAISILNKCKPCIEIHKEKLAKKDVTRETFFEIAKIVSVLSSAAVAMDIERLRSYDFVLREASVDD